MNGIWPILYAYFDATDQLDRESMRVQVQSALRAGAPGIAILGLATEVNKLSMDEKRNVIEWAAHDIDGAVPLAVTLSGATVEEQLALAELALATRVGFFILQPPARVGGPISEGDLEAFFADVLCGLSKLAPNIPIGIQNAPEFLGVGLNASALARLRARCANLMFMKGETPSVIIERTIQQVGAGFPVLNGRGGMELLDNLRAGCAGMVVAPDCALEQQQIAQLFASGAIDDAEALYGKILPTIVFVMQSLETLVVYGKRIAAWRMGIDVQHDRRCVLVPSPFGLSTARRFAEQLGPLPGCSMAQPNISK